MTIETSTETPKKNRKRAQSVDPAKGAEWEDAAAKAAEAVVDARQEAMPPRRFEGLLPCKLTDEERLDRMEQLEAAMQHADEIEAARKLASDGAKARHKLQMERVRELRETLRTKTEERNVEQCERFDLRRCTAQVVRTDTGEIVSERALRQHELQPELPLTSGDGQMTLGDATDMTDPEALLRAAQVGEADPADARLDNEPSASDLSDDEDPE
jgi:hypothetical protein